LGDGDGEMDIGTWGIGYWILGHGLLLNSKI